MNQQVIVIHGADTFIEYDDYLASLTSRSLSSLDDLRRKSWKSRLGEILGSNFYVYNPQMPNKDNSRYKEWKIWFEKMVPLFNDNVIFVGHSMGAIFLVKYFSENFYNKKIKGLFLVAAPYEDSSNESLGDFNREGDISTLVTKIANIFIYHSEDDYVVPFAHGEAYASQLLGSTFRIFKDRGHFNQESFSEIVEDIKNLVSTSD